MRPALVSLVLAVWSLAVAAQSVAPASVTVTVLDPSGAQVLSASLLVVEGPGVLSPGRTYGSVAGPIVAADLETGVYTLRVDAPGFESVTLERLRIAGVVHRTVRLPLARISDSVVVQRNRQDTALDPRGFSTFLSREQIDALPDDPEAFARALESLAPPGAVIRVDGFTGGILPPKSQILSIRLPRIDSYAAQDHGGLSGLSFIDIVTTPGGGRLQGGGDIAVRHHVLNARHPLSSTKGLESSQTGGFALDGPVVAGAASFALALRVADADDTTAIHAVLPDGRLVAEPVVRPREQVTLSGRLTATLGAGHTLRVALSNDRRVARNLGVGDTNLPDRAFQTSATDTSIRAAGGGPLGRRAFLDVRMHTRWASNRSASNTEAPTLRVLDAFASGGAQVAGGVRAFEWLAAADVDYARGAHAYRVGGILEAGTYQANRRSNYLGTYTFTSLQHYVAGMPASYTRRMGNAEVEYDNVQVGLYAQDDYRAARSLLLSYGIRYERQSLTGERGRLLPRAALSWSPFRGGETTVRAGGGLFSDWMGVTVYEQSLVLDGTRQHDLHVRQPEYPDPPDPGAAITVVPRDHYLLDDDLRLPLSLAFSIGIEQQVGESLRVYATYARRRGRYLPRGENLNAPVHGERPDPTQGNAVEARSDAGLRGHTATVHLATTRPSSRTSIAAAYVFTGMESNTTGAFAVPASGRLAAEWGATSPAHVLTGTLSTRATSALTLTVQPQWRSGMPYTITAGRDENGDGLFTDRPLGLPRNSERTGAHLEFGVRVAYAIPLRSGDRSTPRPSSASSDASAARAGESALAEASATRQRIELFASAQNVTNRPNYVGVGSVVGSPLFGKPTVALNPRRLEIGARVLF